MKKSEQTETESGPKKLTPWDFTDSINQSKKDLMRDTENDAAAEAAYSPFMVNRAMSYYPDTIMVANEMNSRAHLDNRAQFLFYLGSVAKRRRFSKWGKARKTEAHDAVMGVYKCSSRRANALIRLLTPDQIETVIETHRREDDFVKGKR